jgi:glycosyltransferase involved in cell wall biosynthesis
LGLCHAAQGQAAQVGVAKLVLRLHASGTRSPSSRSFLGGVTLPDQDPESAPPSRGISMNHHSSVSVVIPTYNGRAFLEDALRSVWQQTQLPDEVIIVDDASTDQTADLAEELARRAPVPTRVLRQMRNSGGPARPTNVGVAAATGDLIAILDQDDVFLPRKVEAQRRVLESDPTLSFAFGLCANFNDPQQILQSDALVAELISHAEPRDGWYALCQARTLARLMSTGMFVRGHPGMMVRRSDWLRKGGLDELLPIASDEELVMWLLLRGRAGFVAEPHYLRRTHGSNASDDRAQIRVDNVRIKARYTASALRILNGSIEKDEVVDLKNRAAYWAREFGYYRDAAWIHLVSLGYGLDRLNDVQALAKLVPHYLHRRIAAKRISLDA